VHALMLTFTPAHPHAHTLPPIAACSVEALLKQFDDFEKSIDAKEDEVASMEEDAAAIELALRTGKIDMERVGADGAGIALRSASFNRLAMRGAGSGAALRRASNPQAQSPSTPWALPSAPLQPKARRSSSLGLVRAAAPATAAVGGFQGSSEAAARRSSSIRPFSRSNRRFSDGGDRTASQAPRPAAALGGPVAAITAAPLKPPPPRGLPTDVVTAFEAPPPLPSSPPPTAANVAFEAPPPLPSSPPPTAANVAFEAPPLPVEPPANNLFALSAARPFTTADPLAPPPPSFQPPPEIPPVPTSSLASNFPEFAEEDALAILSVLPPPPGAADMEPDLLPRTPSPSYDGESEMF